MLHSRLERVRKLLQSEIGRIIDQDLQDPRLPELITVADVKVSKDLSSALVLITFLDDQTEDVIRETVDELNHSAPYVRKLLTGRTYLKRHPRLKFAYNPTTRRALDLEHVFHQIQREPPVEIESSEVSCDHETTNASEAQRRKD